MPYFTKVKVEKKEPTMPFDGQFIGFRVGGGNPLAGRYVARQLFPFRVVMADGDSSDGYMVKGVTHWWPIDKPDEVTLMRPTEEVAGLPPTKCHILFTVKEDGEVRNFCGFFDPKTMQFYYARNRMGEDPDLGYFPAKSVESWAYVNQVASLADSLDNPDPTLVPEC